MQKKNHNSSTNKNPNTSFVIVAEVDGKFAGFQRADIQEIPSFFKHNKIFYLDDAYVLPEYRRMGIATLLIKKAEKKIFNRAS